MPHKTPEHIEALVNYYPKLEDGEVYPVQYIATIGFQRQSFDRQLVKVTDIHSSDEEFNVEKQGFQVIKSTIPESTWDDDAAIQKQAYYGQVREMLMEVTGATYVHPFPPHVIRRDSAQSIAEISKGLPDSARHNKSPPAHFVHVGQSPPNTITPRYSNDSSDQSYEGAQIVLHRLPEIEKLRPKTRTRWGIMNVWQPLKAVKREPLAVCDARSVEESDLKAVTTRIVLGEAPNDRNVDNEQWHMIAKPEHRWYYCSDMTPQEALLIKIFDSKKDGRARRVPHTAIQTQNDEGPPRESIEIRCLVFWEDQELE